MYSACVYITHNVQYMRVHTRALASAQGARAAPMDSHAAFAAEYRLPLLVTALFALHYIYVERPKQQRPSLTRPVPTGPVLTRHCANFANFG